MSNYGKKSDLTNVAGVDKSDFVKKINLPNLKPKVDILDIGKLKTTPVDLSKLSKIVKKTVSDELVKKV